MTALSADRPIKRLGEHVDPGIRQISMADGVCCYAGGLVALNSAGYALPAAVSTAVYIVGVCEETADNTVTGHSLGAIRVKVREGCFLMVNSTNHACTRATVGTACYAEDDCTVGTSNLTNTAAVAGTVEYVGTEGVYVKVVSDYRGVDDSTLRTNLSGTGGAALVGIADAGSVLTNTTVELALQELAITRFDTVVAVTPAQINGTNLAAGKTILNGVAARSIYLEGAQAQVNGSTAWDTITNLTISDDNSTVTNVAVINLAALSANAVTSMGMANFLPAKGVCLGTVAATNLVIRADKNLAGNTPSTINLHLWGRIA